MKTIRRIAAMTASVYLLLSSPLIISAEENEILNLQNTNSSDYVSIDIDGSYDDWEDKPHSKIRYDWDAANSYHSGALFRDEDFLYLHVKMSDISYSQFNGYNYRFTVDGVETFVAAVPPEGSSIVNGQNPIVVRAQNGYKLIEGAGGIVTRASGKGDEWEIKIPLKFFTKTPETVKEIKFYCSNLGPQEIVSTGTPTLPFVIAGAGLAIAATGYFIAKRKKI